MKIRMEFSAQIENNHLCKCQRAHPKAESIRNGHRVIMLLHAINFTTK